MRIWLLAAVVASASAAEEQHPALGALRMGGDLVGRARGPAYNVARRRRKRSAAAAAAAAAATASAAPSDQCDPHAVAMAAVAADATRPIAVNSTVYAQWAWGTAAAARAPPLANDWIGLYCARSPAALQAMSDAMLTQWNLFNTTYKPAGGGLVGRLGFSVPAIDAWGWGGVCEFRYFTHRDGTPYCLSSTQATPFLVAGMPNEGAALPVSLIADRAIVKVGDTLNIQYVWAKGRAAAAKDWVGIYCASDAVALLDVPTPRSAKSGACRCGSVRTSTCPRFPPPTSKKK